MRDKFSAKRIIRCLTRVCTRTTFACRDTSLPYAENKLLAYDTTRRRSEGATFWKCVFEQQQSGSASCIDNTANSAMRLPAYRGYKDFSELP